jgi:hypothetical protein
MNPLRKQFRKYAATLSPESRDRFVHLFDRLERAISTAESSCSVEDGDVLPEPLSQLVAVRFLRDAAELDARLPEPVLNVGISGLITLMWSNDRARVEIIIDKDKALIIGSRSTEINFVKRSAGYEENDSRDNESEALRAQLRELAVA